MITRKHSDFRFDKSLKLGVGVFCVVPAMAFQGCGTTVVELIRVYVSLCSFERASTSTQTLT